jgi:hypothetical protein
MSYEDEVRALAPLMSFDSGVFRGDAEVPQSVCNFVLALAVAYNDLRDVAFGINLLEPSRPQGPPKPTREFGHFGGMQTSLNKALVGIIHETLNLIGKESAAVGHPFFRRVVNSCSPTARSAWTSLVAAAMGEAEVQPLSRALMLMRNKVAFHYDAKEIHRAYEECFPARDGAPEPYVSAGDSMRSTRFYFADRSVEWYLGSLALPDGQRLILNAGRTFVEQINCALYEIVTKFVPARGGGWRPGR